MPHSLSRGPLPSEEAFVQWAGDAVKTLAGSKLFGTFLATFVKRQTKLDHKALRGLLRVASQLTTFLKGICESSIRSRLAS